MTGMVRVTYVDEAGFLGTIESDNVANVVRIFTTLIGTDEIVEVRNVEGSRADEFKELMNATGYFAFPV